MKIHLRVPFVILTLINGAWRESAQRIPSSPSRELETGPLHACGPQIYYSVPELRKTGRRLTFYNRAQASYALGLLRFGELKLRAVDFQQHGRVLAN